MNFQEYQDKSGKTAVYPNIGSNHVYPTLGLAGEAGEIANKIKKVMRDDDGKLTDARRQDIHDELGDVLWYVAQLATELGFNLNEVAQANIDKLYSRMDRGQLKGDGDHR